MNDKIVESTTKHSQKFEQAPATFKSIRESVINSSDESLSVYSEEDYIDENSRKKVLIQKFQYAGKRASRKGPHLSPRMFKKAIKMKQAHELIDAPERTQTTILE